MNVSKVFCYIVRRGPDGSELLVLESQDAPGFEAIRGKVDSGEDLEAAAQREIFEETGLIGVRLLRELGAQEWEGEDQHFYLMDAPGGVPDQFEHTVTGEGGDQGKLYRYRWLPINQTLTGLLVQGSQAYAQELIDATL